MQSLDELLGTEEPYATFRDAELTELRVDYDARTLSATFSLCVGDPAAADEAERGRRRAGWLELTGLLLWALEPPAPAVPAARVGRPRLAEDGALEDSPAEAGRMLARTIPASAWTCYLFFSDSDSSAYCAATSAAFRWV